MGQVEGGMRISPKYLKIVLILGAIIWIIPVISKLRDYQRGNQKLTTNRSTTNIVRRDGRVAGFQMFNYEESEPRILPTKKPQGIDANTLRVVHLDLKGAPPLISYLKKWLKYIAQLGCTALLIEYEDMFPFDGILRNVSAKNAYTKAEILDLLQTCDLLKIEVIPLVQTFGHMEYVLKLSDFMHLREVPQYPEVICPSKVESLHIVKELIRQVMAIHRSVKRIHIGCDEVYHMKSCNICSTIADTPSQIFEKHVINIASFLKSAYPGVTPLIWDDMMRHWKPAYFIASKLQFWVEPVVWIYGNDVERSVPNWNWFWYTKIFPKIWVAGSFKGATGELAILPDLTFHLSNQMSWILFLKQNFLLKTTKIIGYILTGWSRYDHFAGLCELLPPATPSLTINLLLVSSSFRNSVAVHNSTEYKNLIVKRATNFLNCSFPAIDFAQVNFIRYENCSFLGHTSYFIMEEYTLLELFVREAFEDFMEKNAWLTAVNQQANFTSPFRIWSRLDYKTWKVSSARVARLEKLARSEFPNYYDVFTIEEWIQQRIRPLSLKLGKMKQIANDSMMVKHWPRRPLMTLS